MANSDEIRKIINLLESVGGYDSHIETTVEWFNPDANSEDESKMFTVTADVNFGSSARRGISGNPESFDLGEDAEVENLKIIDGDGNEVDPDDLSGNGVREWKVYRIGDLALQAVYREMENEGGGPYDFEPSPIHF
jgi:hypothetical protein